MASAPLRTAGTTSDSAMAARAPARTRGYAQTATASIASGISPLKRWSPAEVPGCGCRKLSSITWTAISPTAAVKTMRPRSDPGRSASGSVSWWRGCRLCHDGHPPSHNSAEKAGQPPMRSTGFWCVSAAEEHQHREHAPRLAPGGRQPELAEDARDVFFDGPHRDHELVRDPLVGAARGHQLEHLALPRREGRQGIVVPLPRQQGRDDDWVQRGPAVRDAPHRPDEVVHLADAVLQQIPDALRRVREELHRKSQLDVLRQDEYRHLGVLRADLERRLQALVAVRGRQTDVDDRNVRLVAPHLPQQELSVSALGDDLEARVRQQACQPLAQQHAVLGDRYPHGMSALTRVPPPGGVQTRSRPPSASTRSASPRRPVPRSLSAPPTPSSTTSITRSPLAQDAATVADVAAACLPMFARLSETT